jgi:hypothetical protein
VNKKTLTMLEFPALRTGITAALPNVNPRLGFRTERSNEMFKNTLVTMLMAGLCSIALPAYAQSEQTRRQEIAAQAVQKRTAVVFRFAVQSEPVADSVGLSSHACPQDNNGANSIGSAPSNSAAATPDIKTVDPEILDSISFEIQKRLSKKMPVMVDPDPQTVPVGSLLITGCILKAEKGSSAGRMIGMNVGASRLSAHVVIFSKAETGFTPVDAFDLQVKGGSVLPPLGPIGLAAHAARQPSQTLSADARKLAGQIVKKLDYEALHK